MMKAIAEKVTYPTWAEVHLDRIAHNIAEIRSGLNPRVKFMAVVKANGYGHGTVQVAQAAVTSGADALAVSAVDEAVKLRRAGLTVPLLILAPIAPEQIDTAAEHNVDITVFQADWLKAVKTFKTSTKPVRLHIKMDTGMGRWGVRDRAEWDQMVSWLQADDFHVVGVYTHFATANQPDRTRCEEQFRRFETMRAWVEEAGFRGAIAHCANSAAAIRFPEYALDMVRVGASMFGILPFDEGVVLHRPIRLLPTLALHTTISHIKMVSRGEAVSYDSSYVAQEDEWIATLPIGYADGWFRGYSGLQVLADGIKVGIAGNICMNQTMIRLPYYMPVGTKVTLIGSQLEQSITLDEAASHIGSIPQQVLSLISERVPRVYLPQS